VGEDVIRRRALHARPRAKGAAGRCEGFTLVELIVASGTIALSVAGLLQLFVYCLWQAENSGNLTAAFTEAHGKLEELRNADFERIPADYGPGGDPGPTFALADPPGMGVVYLDTGTPDLIGVEVVVCWRERSAVSGEDSNLNGLLDAGEDANGNGRLDSPASTATVVGRR
jgi:hypothetical protein